MNISIREERELASLSPELRQKLTKSIRLAGKTTMTEKEYDEYEKLREKKHPVFVKAAKKMNRAEAAIIKIQNIAMAAIMEAGKYDEQIEKQIDSMDSIINKARTSIENAVDLIEEKEMEFRFSL